MNPEADANRTRARTQQTYGWAAAVQSRERPADKIGIVRVTVLFTHKTDGRQQTEIFERRHMTKEIERALIRQQLQALDDLDEYAEEDPGPVDPNEPDPTPEQRARDRWFANFELWRSFGAAVDADLKAPSDIVPGVGTGSTTFAQLDNWLRNNYLSEYHLDPRHPRRDVGSMVIRST